MAIIMMVSELVRPEGRNAENHAASLGEAERTHDGDHTS